MIAFQIRSEGLEQAEERLEAIGFELLNLQPIALRVSEIMQTDNMAARMQGVDKDNQPFADLAPSTLDNPFRGMGPPLAPMDMASRIISGFEVEIVPGFNSATVVGSWPSMDAFLGYHVTGTKNMPSRDPVGIRPMAWAEMLDAFDVWVDDVIRE